VPRMSPLALPNGLGLAGMALIAVAVGMLAGWRWALLLAGLQLVTVSWSIARSTAPPAPRRNAPATSRPGGGP
jgi:hypothetical protein